MSMERLELVRQASDESAPVAERPLNVGVSDVDHGCWVSASVMERRLLTSVHVHDDTTEIRQTMHSTPRLSRDNPFLNDEQLRKLDEHGLIREGIDVAEDDVLASVVVPEVVSRRAKICRPRQGMQWVADRSWRVPHGWGGAVATSVKRSTRKELGKRAPRGLGERIQIVLRAERPLETGDVLLIANHPVVVTRILETEAGDERQADLLVGVKLAEALRIESSGMTSLPVAKADDRAAETMHARGSGPYSLITQQPLRNPPFGGQAITTSHVAWLSQRGLTGLLAELVSFQSDDLANRSRITKSIERSGGLVEIPNPTASESLNHLVAWLRTIGLSCDLADAGDHVRLSPRPATSAAVREHSSGEVLKPETVNYRTLDDEDDGLFAPGVFGPSDQSRRRRFGHVELAAPVVPMLWRVGSPSVLSRVLGISDDEVERVMGHEADVWWSDGRLSLHESDAAFPEQEASAECLGRGAIAVQQLLERIPAERIPASLQSCREWLVSRTVSVLPPGLRPLVLLDSGDFATHDVNDLYRHLINRNNRLKTLRRLSAPTAIVAAEERQLQETVDALHANMMLPEEKAIRDERGRRLKCAMAMILGCLELDRKTVDWSGRARLVADKRISEERVMVPHELYETLRLDKGSPVLLTGCHESRFIALYPQPHDERVLRVSPGCYRQLVRNNEPASVVQLHRPVTPAGHEAAQRLVRNEAVAVNAVNNADEPNCWLDSDSDEKVRRLINAAIDRQPLPLRSPRGLLLGGTGATDVRDDEELEVEAETDDRREAAVPARPKYSTPSHDQIIAVVNGHLRKTCVFDIRRVERPPSPERGRIGGAPYLPAGVTWPMLHGKPLPFVGQFPLEPARRGGVLPMDVPADSMITIFGGDDCWELGPCDRRCPVFIHSVEGLQRHPTPGKLDAAESLCEIAPRIVEEVPHWNEMCEILDWELDQPERKTLHKFYQQEWANIPSANDAVKIGGWPAWIQAPDSQQPLLLQIASNAAARFTFADGATLYLFIEDNGQFTCCAQWD